jgi:hypothetical protein
MQERDGAPAYALAYAYEIQAYLPARYIKSGDAADKLQLSMKPD